MEMDLCKCYDMYMKPISVEVVTNVLAVLNACSSCRLVFNEGGVHDELLRDALEEYPEELKEEFLRLSEWMAELGRLYRHRIRIRVVDAKSIRGIYKSLRYRFRSYPAFIVDKEDVVAGWDREKLARVLEAHMDRDKGKRMPPG